MARGVKMLSALFESGIFTTAAQKQLPRSPKLKAGRINYHCA